MKRYLLLIVTTMLVWIAAIGCGGDNPPLGITEEALGSKVQVALEVQGDYDEDEIDAAVRVIRARLEALDMETPYVKREGETIIVAIPDTEDVAETLEVITMEGDFQFREVLEAIFPGDPAYDTETLTDVDAMDIKSYWGLKGAEITLPYKSPVADELIVHLGPSLLSGDVVTEASVEESEGGEGYIISFALTDEATAEFARITAEMKGRQLAIVFDYVIRSLVTVIEPIKDGRGEIQGGFTEREARTMAIVMMSGALPVRLAEDPVIKEP